MNSGQNREHGLTGKYIDGLVGAGGTMQASIAANQTAASQPAKPAVAANIIKKHPVHRSKTLHRATVNKPTASSQPSNVDRSIRTSMPAHKVSEHRARTAQNISRSPQIDKFSRSIGVRPQLVSLAPNTSRPISPPAYRPDPVTVETALKNVFEKHFESATPPVRTTKPRKSFFAKMRRARVMAPALAALLLVTGFVAYQQVPYVSMRVASSRAGFNASLPSTPSGFSVDGPIAYNSGVVSVKFKSNSDTRAVVLNQQPSGLDSASLQAGLLDKNKVDYQEHKVNGRTVFIYEDSHATWVNKGVWYTLEGDSNLSTGQILELVKSL